MTDTAAADCTATTDEHGIQWWPYGGNTALVTPVTHLHRRFMHDPELVALDAILQETRALITNGTVPRSVRLELADIGCQLACLLHAGPHLMSRR